MQMVGLFTAIWKLVKIWVFKSDFRAKIWEIKNPNGNRKWKEIVLLVKGKVRKWRSCQDSPCFGLGKGKHQEQCCSFEEARLTFTFWLPDHPGKNCIFPFPASSIFFSPFKGAYPCCVLALEKLNFGAWRRFYCCHFSNSSWLEGAAFLDEVRVRKDHLLGRCYCQLTQEISNKFADQLKANRRTKDRLRVKTIVHPTCSPVWELNITVFSPRQTNKCNKKVQSISEGAFPLLLNKAYIDGLVCSCLFLSVYRL